MYHTDYKQWKATFVVDMMNKIHRNYWTAFNRIGNETLHQNGFSFDMLPEQSESLSLFRINSLKEMTST
ncbi:hypothetical protein EZ449_05770 [Pedobacter frigidisoli]|uniref:Uncharacterized protein n=1 Tax=Pedobacter frigidisoli TaxID=2530455 RepID=A0A4R0P8M4_9SPHI|nr:hypothetical protein [Pedobacter frigidisoli]TCD11007.1 hypothetical protein EZ449_05770 [Pedobacter frigidisoli]